VNECYLPVLSRPRERLLNGSCYIGTFRNCLRLILKMYDHVLQPVKDTRVCFSGTNCLMWVPGCNAPLIHFFSILALYIVCLCTSYASPHIFFSSLFLTYLLPYLSFPLRIDPRCFQAGCRKRRLHLALVFCAYFVL